MKTRHIRVKSERAPVVELDSEARAAYVRFSGEPVAVTHCVTTNAAIVTIDCDAQGSVVGVELVGITEFSINHLMEVAGLQPLPRKIRERTEYVPAKAA